MGLGPELLGNGYAGSRTRFNSVTLLCTLSLALCNLIRAPDQMENVMFNNAVPPAENKVMKNEYCPPAFRDMPSGKRR